MQNTELRIVLESFQGPFDLLLHLIKQMEVDINDIPMTEITNQYIKYIEAMNKLELDIIGEYLVMAATLLEIKSNILLPIEPSPDYEEDYDEGDPRDILVQQLLLYQQFQTVATQLQIKQDERARLFSRPMADLSSYQEFVPLDEDALSLTDLAEAMASVVEKAASREPLERQIQHESLTVSDQMDKIMAAFQFDTDNDSVTLDQFFQYGTRNEIITTFLAMLELVRKQHLIFLQKGKDDPIQMKKLEE
ncbi:segregation and condensation protein A [Ruoffia tabacinasalis]|uniref:segregation and condensation protein A n=1 Tax=Ruoffia tabacinasalis TaxID=87458 RepID=UPI0030D17326